jgi:hypothetical protein
MTRDVPLPSQHPSFKSLAPRVMATFVAVSRTCCVTAAREIVVERDSDDV